AESCALASACKITRSCEGPLGAVKPLLAPSWLMALPLTTASTGCPRRCASERRSSATSPTPSDHPTPSAEAAKGLQRPSAAKPLKRLKARYTVGVEKIVTPPARASEHSSWRSA